MKNVRSEMKNQNDLSVAARVGAALQIQRHGGSSKRMSVSEICRLAGVNRANLYATHPEIVAAILGHPIGEKAVRPSKETAQARQGRVSSASASQQEKALLYLCLELQAEVQSLRALRKASKSLRGDKGLARGEQRRGSR